MTEQNKETPRIEDPGYSCPICGSPLRYLDVARRGAHVKACGRKYKVTPEVFAARRDRTQLYTAPVAGPPEPTPPLPLLVQQVLERSQPGPSFESSPASHPEGGGEHWQPAPDPVSSRKAKPRRKKAVAALGIASGRAPDPSLRAMFSADDSVDAVLAEARAKAVHVARQEDEELARVLELSRVEAEAEDVYARARELSRHQTSVACPPMLPPSRLRSEYAEPEEPLWNLQLSAPFTDAHSPQEEKDDSGGGTASDLMARLAKLVDTKTKDERIAASDPGVDLADPSEVKTQSVRSVPALEEAVWPSSSAPWTVVQDSPVQLSGESPAGVHEAGQGWQEWPDDGYEADFALSQPVLPRPVRSSSESPPKSRKRRRSSLSHAAGRTGAGEHSAQLVALLQEEYTRGVEEAMRERDAALAAAEARYYEQIGRLTERRDLMMAEVQSQSSMGTLSAVSPLVHAARRQSRAADHAKTSAARTPRSSPPRMRSSPYAPKTPETASLQPSKTSLKTPTFDEYSVEELREMVRRYGVHSTRRSRAWLREMMKSVWRAEQRGTNEPAPRPPTDAEDTDGLVSESESRAASKKSRLAAAIRAAPDLYRKILTYQEVQLDDVLAAVAAHGLKVGRAFLGEYLDDSGVVYRDLSHKKGTAASNYSRPFRN